MSNITAEGRELLAELTKITDDVKNVALDAQKKAGDLGATLRAEIDTKLQAQGEVRERLTAVEQAIASKLEASGSPVQQSIGERFVADAGVSHFLSNRVNAGAVRATFDGYSLKNAINGNTDAAGGVLRTPQYVPGIIQPGLTRLTIRDLLMWGTTSAESIRYRRELAFTNNAAPVSELVTKPESNLTFEEVTANVITIAHWVKESKQIVADVPGLQSYVNTRMMRGLKEKEEAQLLKGSGVGNNLNGLYTAASAYSNPGVAVDTENRMDRLRLAILQASLSGYVVDGIVLHPADVAAIELTKTASDKAYLARNPFTGAISGLWGVRLVESTAITAGTYLVGAFGTAAMGWDREQMSVQLGYEGTDFIDNAVTVLCEERLALAVYRPDALIKGSFGSVD